MRNAALVESNVAAANPNASAPRVVVGTLPQCQVLSASEMKRPASPSKSSTVACPSGFGLGCERATSAETLREEGASVWIPGSRLSARVSHCGWKCSSVLAPPMKLDEGSRPSGGRVKTLCCFWNSPAKLISPRSPRS